MLEHAEHQFNLGKPGKDGKPLRDTLETVERMTGRRPPDLDGPDLPEGAAHIWHWFLELNKRRDTRVGHAPPITHIAMAAFFGLYCIVPDVWELHAIDALDDLYLKEANGH